MSDETTIRLRDTRGRFISTHNHDDIVDAEIIEDTPGSELAVRPTAALPAMVSEPDSLPDILLTEALQSVTVDRGNASSNLQRAIGVIERLYPDMAQKTGVEREFTFDPELTTAKARARMSVLP